MFVDLDVTIGENTPIYNKGSRHLKLHHVMSIMDGWIRHTLDNSLWPDSNPHEVATLVILKQALVESCLCCACKNTLDWRLIE